MGAPQAFFFELDQASVESARLHQVCWVEACEEFGIDATPLRRTQAVGRPDHWYAERLLPLLGPESAVHLEAIFSEKRERFLSNLDELQPVAGAEDFLARLEGEYPLGLITSLGLRVSGQILQAMGWRNRFTIVFAAEHLHAPKPDPTAYRRAAERARLLPGECVMFESQLEGVEGALAAEMPVVGVQREPQARKALFDTGAGWTLEDFTDHTTLTAITSGEPIPRPNWLRRFFS